MNQEIIQQETLPISGTASVIGNALGVHRSTINRWSKEPGAPRPYRTGKQPRWLLEDWIKWARAQRLISPDGRQSHLAERCNRS